MKKVLWLFPGLFLLLLIACWQQVVRPVQQAPAEAPPAETTDEYLEADGSLDSVLQLLTGSGLAYDTAFVRLNPKEGWLKKQVNGECHLLTDLKYPGLTINIDGFYPDCPPEPGMGADIRALTLRFNGTPLHPEKYRYQISGDSVSIDWHYAGYWRKFRLGNQDWLLGQLDNMDCNGSFCMYNASLLVQMDGGQPAFYFFDHFPEPGLLADTDGDQRLEWLEMDFGDWQQDTIHLTIKPYELNGGRFKPMRDGSGRPYEAVVEFSNGLYEPRAARLVRKYWPG